LSNAPVVDRNYWSNYTAKYPNAKELDGLGIWDTPYVYGRFQGVNSSIDHHPLMFPITVPMFPDIMVPIISVVSPENKVYTSNNVSLAVTVNEPVVWIGYSLDGEDNVTVT
jgi:hypothetical protein